MFIGNSLALSFPTATQSPACGYTVISSYSVGGVTSAVFPWLTADTHFSFAPTLASDVGTYTFEYLSAATDTGGLISNVTSSFTL